MVAKTFKRNIRLQLRNLRLYLIVKIIITIIRYTILFYSGFPTLFK